jgi:glucosamine--fructose-6-phosphate aminotransferase (isomerizing)
MCGIVGYLGPGETSKILLQGLKRLEYRGYDSAGLTVYTDGKLKTVKTHGRVEELEKLVGDDLGGDTGIAHTRWATHGKPNRVNAHPHLDCHQNTSLVHNGIIENYQTLKENLIAEGHEFQSQTDTEVLVHLIEKFSAETDLLEQAVVKALKLVKGTYGIAVVSKAEPDKMVVARNSSPLLVGIGESEKFVASDASAILPYTKKIIYLEDSEVGVIEADNLRFINLDDQNDIKKQVETLDWEVADILKNGYDHFMLKEIFEQPESIRNSIRGRIDQDNWEVVLGGLENVRQELKQTKRFIITACGTAYLAGLVGKYLIEEFCSLPAEVDYASELRYRSPVLKDSTFLCISQSGETADTLAGLKQANENGNLSLGVVNVVGSTIARETQAGVYNHVGPEIGVASTKAFTSQLVVLGLITMFINQLNGSDNPGKRKKILKQVVELSKKIELILDQNEKIKELAEKYYQAEGFYFIGRKYSYPVALEGALKLKEISYIHAEGYPAGEMKHGPIALIDDQFPTFGVIPQDSVYDKTYSNLEEIKARNGPILAVASQGDEQIKQLTEDVIYIAEIAEPLSPILSVIPLQLFAYHMAVLNERDVDKPRNLAKSVTVE